MKLVYCPDCRDVFRLWKQEPRQSHCGSSWGQYIEDDLTAIIGGKAIPLAILNDSLHEAIADRPASGMGRVFTACVIPEDCGTLRYE